MKKKKLRYLRGLAFQGGRVRRMCVGLK